MNSLYFKKHNEDVKCYDLSGIYVIADLEVTGMNKRSP
jgi:hypothetical protein